MNDTDYKFLYNEAAKDCGKYLALFHQIHEYIHDAVNNHGPFMRDAMFQHLDEQLFRFTRMFKIPEEIILALDKKIKEVAKAEADVDKQLEEETK